MLSVLVAANVLAPAIFPMPAHYEARPGAFVGHPSLRFTGVSDPHEVSRLRECLGQFLKSGSDGTVDLRIDPKLREPEGYSLRITPRTIVATAASTKGLYWSLQTLRQLQTTNGIPCAAIDDAPRFPWRGVLLDEGRHFMGADFVKRFIDVLSLYKFNVLHWHLTEDQGWRIEIKAYPQLTKVGAWRREADRSTSGGFYTQKQIKDIVAYASRRNITIVPEIEMPGHSSAAIASYPELGCTRQQIQVPATWGVFQDVYCAGRESTFTFLSTVLAEVLPLFPSKFVHVGGDEVPKQHWSACPDCQTRIKTEGLKDEHELQSYFIRRIQTLLAGKGKTLIGWDEIMQGGLAPGAVVQIWEDQNLARQAIDAGNRVILSPSSHCYLNRPADQLPMQQVYPYDPMEGISDPSKIMGLETTLWSEQISSGNCLLKFFPRGLAMSEIFWHSGPKDYPTFEDRVRRHERFMDANGIDYGPEDRAMLTYTVASDASAGVCRLDAVFGMPGSELRYSIGKGSDLSSDSSIEWPLGRTLTMRLFHKGKPVQEPIRFETARHLALAHPLTLANNPSPRYAKAGAAGLVDGLLGTSDFHDGLWLGWDGVDLVATVDLGKPIAFKELALHCLQQMRSWILMPKSVRFETSTDGANWQPVGEAPNRIKDTEEAQITEWFTVRATGTARFIRATAANYGDLPSWHNGVGGKAFIFADELVVR